MGAATGLLIEGLLIEAEELLETDKASVKEKLTKIESNYKRSELNRNQKRRISQLKEKLGIN